MSRSWSLRLIFFNFYAVMPLSSVNHFKLLATGHRLISIEYMFIALIYANQAGPVAIRSQIQCIVHNFSRCTFHRTVWCLSRRTLLTIFIRNFCVTPWLPWSQLPTLLVTLSCAFEVLPTACTWNENRVFLKCYNVCAYVIPEICYTTQHSLSMDWADTLVLQIIIFIDFFKLYIADCQWKSIHLLSLAINFYVSFVSVKMWISFILGLCYVSFYYSFYFLPW